MNEFLVMIIFLLVVITAIVAPIVIFCAKKAEKVKENIQKQKEAEAEASRLYKFYLLKGSECAELTGVQLAEKLEELEGQTEGDREELRLEKRAINEEIDKRARQKRYDQQLKKQRQQEQREADLRAARLKKDEEERARLFEAMKKRKAEENSMEGSFGLRFPSPQTPRHANVPIPVPDFAKEITQVFSNGRVNSASSDYSSSYQAPTFSSARKTSSGFTDNKSVSKQLANYFSRLDDTLQETDQRLSDMDQNEFDALERTFDELADEFDKLDLEFNIESKRGARPHVRDLYQESSSSSASSSSSSSED